MWVGQPLHCGTIAKNPICDPGGGWGEGGGGETVPPSPPSD